MSRLPVLLVTALALNSIASYGSANPVRLAVEARVDLYAEAGVGRLEALYGFDGDVRRMHWVAESERPRTMVGHWAVADFLWREVRFGFTPQSNGTVTLDLLGPWVWHSGSNAIFRLEVLWDAVTAIGASLTNGGFELLAGGIPVGWQNPWGGPVVLETNPPAAEGTYSVRVWHDRRIRTHIAVTGNVPVEIRAYVRAYRPPEVPEAARLPASATPAHQAARRFMRGVNLGNVFEAGAGENWGGGPITDADLEAIRAEGFDHIRIPIRWSAHTGPGPDFAISNAFLARVDAVVTGALARGLGVILNVHHFEEFFQTPPLWTNKLYAIWSQLARFYSNAPLALAFEILNEPHDPATTEFMSDVYAHVIPLIRVHSPNRVIFVGPGNWNRISELPRLRLPAGDSNLIVTVHLYDPSLFTHQGTPWMGAPFATTNVIYPGPPASPLSPHPGTAPYTWVADWIESYNTCPQDRNPASPKAFAGLLKMAAEWAAYYGRPVHVGEFGSYIEIEPASRARYTRDMRAAMDELGMGWALWDWSGAFKYWHRPSNAPFEGLREALFPAPLVGLHGSPPTVTGSSGAVGKIFVLERAAPVFPLVWQPVYTQLLETPSFIHSPAGDTTAALFRLLWRK